MAATQTFKIAQDFEKENPRTINLKENAAIGSKSHALQPLGTTLGGVSSKHGRANFAVLNSNANARAHLTGGGSNVIAPNNNHKLAFRDVGNVKGNVNKDDTLALAAKKSTVVPVEQFKTFSVYEDSNEVEEAEEHQSVVVITKQNETIADSATSHDVVDKENFYFEKQQQYQQQRQQHILTERRVIQKYEENEYLLATTPMSVTDVLSPMSVDRSNSTSHLFDDSNSKEIAEQSDDIESLPRNDRQRFFEVVEYQRAILEYFRESEKKHRPKPHYMRRQTDINHSMRTILVDWLVEVSEEYKLDTETLYLSISYIDRFLSHMSVVRNKLQLVGTAAMYIASKYEEIYPPDVSEFVFITDDTYNKAQVLRMEQIILKILAFDLCTPTAYVFINTYSVLIDIPDKVKFLTLYIAELSLLEAEPYLRFCPSIISASALALARHLYNLPIWSAELEEITTYRLEDLNEVFLSLCKTHNAAIEFNQQAIQEKYKSEKFRKVSIVAPQKISEEQFEEIVKQYKLSEESREQLNPSATAVTTASTMAKVNMFFKF